MSDSPFPEAAPPPIGLVRLHPVDAERRTSPLASSTCPRAGVTEFVRMSIQAYAYPIPSSSYHELADTVSSETVPSNGSSGPGLSGLQQSAAVNQSAGEPTAQVRLSAHLRIRYSFAHTSISIITMDMSRTLQPMPRFPVSQSRTTPRIILK